MRSDIDRALEAWLREATADGWPHESPGAWMQSRGSRDTVGGSRSPTARGTQTRTPGRSRPPGSPRWSPEAARVERVMQALRDADSQAYAALMADLRGEAPAEGEGRRRHRERLHTARVAVVVALG